MTHGLPLSAVADVILELAPVSAPRRGFNLGLIIGNSEIIDPADRVVVYSSLDEMVSDGFSTESPEYKAASLYFSATSSPRQVAIGVQSSGETALQAIQACRTANQDWYIAQILNASNADHLEVAEYVEALKHFSQYHITSDDPDIVANQENNLFAQIKELGYRRTLGMYSTETDHAVAAVMGYAMGQTSDLANSAYTLKFKRLPGVEREDLTTQQVNNILGNNGNVYINRGHFYNWLEEGKVFSGDWFDEIIYLDKLANEIQLNVADLLYQSPKVPQTESGMARLRIVIAQACDKLVKIGFIAPGQWNGAQILTLNTGDYLPAGYLVLSESIDEQEQADRDARKAPPIYVPIKLAGAIHSVLIKVDVNR